MVIDVTALSFNHPRVRKGLLLAPLAGALTTSVAVGLLVVVLTLSSRGPFEIDGLVWSVGTAGVIALLVAYPLTALSSVFILSRARITRVFPSLARISAFGAVAGVAAVAILVAVELVAVGDMSWSIVSGLPFAAGAVCGASAAAAFHRLVLAPDRLAV